MSYLCDGTRTDKKIARKQQNTGQLTLNSGPPPQCLQFKACCRRFGLENWKKLFRFNGIAAICISHRLFKPNTLFLFASFSFNWFIIDFIGSTQIESKEAIQCQHHYTIHLHSILSYSLLINGLGRGIVSVRRDTFHSGLHICFQSNNLFLSNRVLRLIRRVPISGYAAHSFPTSKQELFNDLFIILFVSRILCKTWYYFNFSTRCVLRILLLCANDTNSFIADTFVFREQICHR